MSHLDKLKASYRNNVNKKVMLHICNETCEAILKDVEEIWMKNTSGETIEKIKQLLKGDA